MKKWKQIRKWISMEYACIPSSSKHHRNATKKGKEEAYEKYISDRKAMQDKLTENDKQNVLRLNKLSRDAQTTMLNSLADPDGIASQNLKENNKKIAQYEQLRLELLGKKGGGGEGLARSLASDAGIPDPLPDPEVVGVGPGDGVDFFIPISVEISSSSSSESSSSHATAKSMGASASWGFLVLEVMPRSLVQAQRFPSLWPRTHAIYPSSACV